MSRFRKTPIVLALMASAVVALNSVAFAQSAAPTVPVKIGILGPFTGPVASIGTEQLNWAKLAVEDFNKATGWNVELVQGDTQLTPSIAVTAAQSLISDADIYGVVGPAGSQEVDAVGQMFTDANLVQVGSSATKPSLTTSGYKSFFRVVPTDDAQGPTDGNFLANQLGVTSLYVIDDQSSYSVGLADAASAAFEADGGTIAGRESVTQLDTDFSSLVTKIKATGAGAIFFPGQVASQGAVIAKNMQEQNYDAILFGADGFQSDTDFIAGAAGAAEGAYVSSFAPDIHSLEGSADVVKRFGDEYGTFGTFGPPTYVATTVILEAIQRASDAGTLAREAVLAEVAKTDMETTILGTPLAFDENGDVEGAESYIFMVQDGKFVFVPAASDEMTPAATAES
ncbi:MAG: branched-chain amino acid ABC transporter substrate-binding protein [Chloroflexota bacterium]